MCAGIREAVKRTMPVFFLCPVPVFVASQSNTFAGYGLVHNGVYLIGIQVEYMKGTNE
jgi:hypothetical protein